MELEADSIGGEGPARELRPLDRALALLDPLLRRALLVVEAATSKPSMSIFTRRGHNVQPKIG